MRSQRNYLFSDQDLRKAIENQERRIHAEIDGIEANRLLNTSPADLEQYFEQSYQMEPPRLREDEIAVDQAETKIDVSRDLDRYIRDRSRPFFIEGTTVTFFIPFDGEVELFKCQPSTYTTAPPRADVVGNELHLRYEKTEHNADHLRNEFDRDLGKIQRYLEWVAKDVAGFNIGLRDKVKARIESRRAKLLKDQGLVAGLGFPMRRRHDAPLTYVVPDVRRKPKIEMPKATTTPYTAEPMLNMGEYEHILNVVRNMVLVMERSPHAFHAMKEEDIRQHFLVQLNGQYEGQATGETFNYQGKTDMLIRFDNKNIFIGECKFWHGPKAFTETIDQILSYSSWRDTRVAIFMFNRQKELSKVLEKIPALIEQHPNYKKRLALKDETAFRAVFHHPGDKNRELILTTMFFDIPTVP